MFQTALLVSALALGPATGGPREGQAHGCSESEGRIRPPDLAFAFGRLLDDEGGKDALYSSGMLYPGIPARVFPTGLLDNVARSFELLESNQRGDPESRSAGPQSSLGALSVFKAMQIRPGVLEEGGQRLRAWALAPPEKDSAPNPIFVIDLEYDHLGQPSENNPAAWMKAACIKTYFTVGMHPIPETDRNPRFAFGPAWILSNRTRTVRSIRIGQGTEMKEIGFPGEIRLGVFNRDRLLQCQIEFSDGETADAFLRPDVED